MRIKKKLNIPDREYTGKSYIYAEENVTIEDMVQEMAHKDDVFEIYDFTDAIFEYKNFIIKCCNSN